MKSIVFATVSPDKKLGSVEAARVARFLRVETNLSDLRVTVMFMPGSPLGLEIGIQVPKLYSIGGCDKLNVKPHLVSGIMRSLMVTSIETLIVGASVDFVTGSRCYLEGNDVWTVNEPVVPPVLVFYDLVDRRLRYINFKGNPSEAPWRPY